MYTQHVYPAYAAHPGPVPNFTPNARLKAHKNENTMDDLPLEDVLDMLDEDKATYL